MRYTKPIAAALALAIGATSIVSTAEARHRHRHHHNGAGLAAAGIFGLAAGALLGSALAQPRYYRSYEPAPVYIAPPPPPVYYQPSPAYYARPDPWTPEWYQYCEQRYRSFDARTGYFLGFDGSYHFCN
jgi:BA14K-like protein